MSQFGPNLCIKLRQTKQRRQSETTWSRLVQYPYQSMLPIAISKTPCQKIKQNEIIHSLKLSQLSQNWMSAARSQAPATHRVARGQASQPFQLAFKITHQAAQINVGSQAQSGFARLCTSLRTLVFFRPTQH